MHASLAWRRFKNPNSLWEITLISKYYDEKNVVNGRVVSTL